MSNYFPKQLTLYYNFINFIIRILKCLETSREPQNMFQVDLAIDHHRFTLRSTSTNSTLMIVGGTKIFGPRWGPTDHSILSKVSPEHFIFGILKAHQNMKQTNSIDPTVFFVDFRNVPFPKFLTRVRCASSLCKRRNSASAPPLRAIRPPIRFG